MPRKPTKACCTYCGGGVARNLPTCWYKILNTPTTERACFSCARKELETTSSTFRVITSKEAQETTDVHPAKLQDLEKEHAYKGPFGQIYFLVIDNHKICCEARHVEVHHRMSFVKYSL
jgi:hypothetical protein